jgi:hypothetical protein
MGLLDTVKNIAGKLFTDGVLAPPEVAKKRLKICYRCQYLLKKTKQCKKCFCFVDEKSKYLNQYCEKW